MEITTLICVILAIILVIISIIGSIVPALPGPPLGAAAILIGHFIDPNTITWDIVIIMAVLTIVVTIVDFIAPSWLTKWGGGSKQSVRGSLIGTIAGLFILPPWGLIFGPFIGAFLGEFLLPNATFGHSLKVAFYSFVAFLLTTGMKLILSFVMMYYIVKACFALF